MISVQYGRQGPPIFFKHMLRFYLAFFLSIAFTPKLKAQFFSHLQQGNGLWFSSQVDFFWPTDSNRAWVNIGLPYPPLQVKGDSSFAYFSNETALNPYSNPIVGAYTWLGKTVLLNGFLPSFSMGIFGSSNGGVLIKNGNAFSLRNSLNTPSLATVKEKFWYHSAKARLDSSVWIAADTGFRRINLNSLQTRILKDESYKGIALYNHMAASGNRWAGFRNDFGVWCILWGDTNARILTGEQLGLGPNRFVFDIAETPDGDTLFTASGFLGNISSPMELYKRKNGILTNQNNAFPELGDSLTFVETEQDGTVWVCAQHRELYQIRGQQIRKIVLPDSLQSVPITQLALDAGNTKWITLQNRGLLKLNDIQARLILPIGKRVCLGDTVLYKAELATIGQGIDSVQWFFGFGDTLQGQEVKFAWTRPGKYPIRLGVWDSNGSFKQFADSILVDYSPVTLLSTSIVEKQFCGSADIRTESPFPTYWKLPDGTIRQEDTLQAALVGKYILVAENGVCQCMDTVEVLNRQTELISLLITKDATVLTNDTVELTLPNSLTVAPLGLGDVHCQPQWKVNQQDKGTGQLLLLPITEQGYYQIEMESYLVNGCPVNGNRSVYVKRKVLKIPNLVTANGDGKNDYFAITDLELFPDSELTIFNRWGKEIFKAKSYQNNWPNAVNEGTYFYRLVAGGTSYSGWIEVMR